MDELVGHWRPEYLLGAADIEMPTWPFRRRGFVARGSLTRASGSEHAGKRLAQVVLGMRAQLVAGRQVEPGEHHDLVARSQILGTLGDLLIEADPRPERAVRIASSSGRRG
jgi:hypothetical protein